MTTRRGFASDNNATVHATVMNAINQANQGHAVGYGDDEYTKKAVEKIQEVFGKNTDVYFVYNGTAANTLAATMLTRSFNSIICAETAHLNADECGAPEKFSGCKLLTIPTKDGKISPAEVKKHVHGFGDSHHSQPKIISITQGTEYGTVYSLDETRQLADFAHSHGMLLHMDGARLANAAASLKCSLKEVTADAGVDVLSFGGTKNGLMFGEAVIFFNKELSPDFKYLRKQGMQLHSKMRYIAVQYQTLLTNNLWLENARHANQMARFLADEVKKIPEIKITQKVEANAVFAIVPKKIIPVIQQKYFFYVWNEETSEVRWMTSFDTTKEDVMQFVQEIKQALK